MILNYLFVEALGVFTFVLDRLLPFDIIHTFATVSLNVINFMPTILKIIADIYYFFPKMYLQPLLSFMAAIMFMRLAIAVWHLFPWGKILG